MLNPDQAAAGALVHLRDERGRKLGSALYSSASQIAVRLLGPEEITEGELPAQVRARLTAAIDFRRRWVRDSDSYRVVFSESDLLPGLIVDKYNDVLTVQMLTQAFDHAGLRESVLACLAEAFPGASLAERVDPHIRELEKLPPKPSQLLREERSSTVFKLNDVRFHFDALAGQKTGAFLDQRENYAAAARYAHGNALDCFTYQGALRCTWRACATPSLAWIHRVRPLRLPSRMSN